MSKLCFVEKYIFYIYIVASRGAGLTSVASHLLLTVSSVWLLSLDSGVHDFQKRFDLSDLRSVCPLLPGPPGSEKAPVSHFVFLKTIQFSEMFVKARRKFH